MRTSLSAATVNAPTAARCDGLPQLRPTPTRRTRSETADLGETTRIPIPDTRRIPTGIALADTRWPRSTKPPRSGAASVDRSPDRTDGDVHLMSTKTNNATKTAFVTGGGTGIGRAA